VARRRNQHEREVSRLRMEAALQAELASAAMAQSAEQRRQYEARILDLKEAGEQRVKELLRTVTALAEQVEFMRTQHYGPRVSGASVAREMPVLPEEFDLMPSSRPLYMSEEEEELDALRAGGHLSPADHAAALEQIRAASGLRVPIQLESS